MFIIIIMFTHPLTDRHTASSAFPVGSNGTEMYMKKKSDDEHDEEHDDAIDDEHDDDHDDVHVHHHHVHHHPDDNHHCASSASPAVIMTINTTHPLHFQSGLSAHLKRKESVHQHHSILCITNGASPHIILMIILTTHPQHHQQLS